MKQENPTRIAAIEFEKYQCFESLTRIDFAPLTLLYGPNSAGKSAVFDALEFIKEFWRNSGRNDTLIKTYFDRWARRTSDSQESKKRTLRIAIEFSPGASVISEFTLFGNPPDSLISEDGSVKLDGEFENWAEVVTTQLCDNNIRLEVELMSLDDQEGNAKYLFMLEHNIFLGRLPIVTAVCGAKSTKSFNFNQMVHEPGELALAVSIYDHDLPGDPFGTKNIIRHWAEPTETIDRATSVDHSKMFTWKDEAEDFYGWSMDPSDVCENSLPPDHQTPTQTAFRVKDTASSTYKIFTQKLNSKCNPFRLDAIPNDISGTSKSIANQINSLTQLATLGLDRLFERHVPPIVTGDRKVPSKDLLTREINMAKNLSEESFSSEDYFVETLCRAGYAQKLLKANDRRQFENSLNFGKSIGERADWFEDPFHLNQSIGKKLNVIHGRLVGEAQLFQLVNETLSENLFQTCLYQLDVKAEVIVELENLTDPLVYTESEYDQIAELSPTKNNIGAKARVSLALKDSHLNNVQFDDVGSGIGYFLPCLVACNMTGLIRIQQPELHLHPALQANVGDVVANAISTESQILCETHSEHLLLRLLKRIRNTNHCLNHEDVAVYYFDPTDSGRFEEKSCDFHSFHSGKSTVVTRQDITPFGDFVHRWPRGFFEERWKELNDD